MPQHSDIETARIQEIIARDLPGWQLSAQTSAPGRAAPAGGRAHIKQVGDLDQLRKKYLSSKQTVLVQPPGGSSPKTADIINGRATIVQG